MGHFEKAEVCVHQIRVSNQTKEGTWGRTLWTLWRYLSYCAEKRGQCPCPLLCPAWTQADQTAGELL